MPKYLHSELLEWPVSKVFDEVNILHELLDNYRAILDVQNERIKEQVSEINALGKDIHDLCVNADDLHYQLGRAQEANALYIKDACERETASEDLTPGEATHLQELKCALDGRERPVSEPTPPRSFAGGKRENNPAAWESAVIAARSRTD